MIEPVEELIEAAMAERLGTIVTGTVVYADPPATVEYWTTPEVTRELLPIDQYQPADLEAGILGVMRGSSPTMESPFLDPSAGLDLYYRVPVWGYVAKGDVIAGTALNRLAADHRRCLMTDRTLGGLVADLRPDGPRETDDGAREPKAFFRQHWLARVIDD